MSSTVYSFLFKAFTFSAGATLLATLPVEKEIPLVVEIADTEERDDTLKSDTLRKSTDKPGATIRWRDYYNNRFAQPRPRSPFYLRDPGNITTRILRDSTGKIAITEQIKTPTGTLDYRAPESMDMDAYNKTMEDRAFKSLLREYAGRQDGKSAMGERGLLPKLDVPPSLSKLLGDDFLNFKPTGFISLDLGVRNQFNDNPTIPIRQRRQTNFIFDQQISINFDARMGDQLGFLTNFDTKANFNFENALKLNYKNPEESFIKGVQAGNINWAINSQLIPGVQNLFGLKTDFQFGKLSATLVASEQKSSKERIVLRGGAQTREFEIRADTYDENRNFFLSQYFRNIYEKSLKSTPVLLSGVQVTRLEVYVTNRTATTETLRNVVGFSDLGEPKPYKNGPIYQPVDATAPAGNASNGLFKTLAGNSDFRQVDRTNSSLEALGLVKTEDYELLRGAKKLVLDRDFTFNPQLGYVSLTNALRNDEILAVSYEYTLAGRSYKVGELTEDYLARKDDEVIALKLLKSSTIRNNTKLPMWDLMMKNIYSLGTNQIEKTGFQLRVIYKDDATGIDNPTLQTSNLKDVPLIRVMGLDRLNPVNDPRPDGNFDFVEGITIDSKTGRVIFPVLEPFGATLSSRLDSEADKNKFVFNELYRTTMIDAQQVSEKNKFFLKGSYQSAGGAEIMLPYGVLETSVTVTSGGVPLSPGSDYLVEAQIGRVRILNSSIFSSGREIVIEFERPDMFQNQRRSLLGTRLDYIANRNLSVGLTAIKYKERPAGYLTRVSIGNEPVNNTMMGFDINFRKDAPWLTKLIDKLPLLQTKEMSSIQLKAEVAKLFPGVTKDVKDRSLVDDFESTRTVYDLARQPQKWRIAAVPKRLADGLNRNDLSYGYKRAKISAYTVDNIFGGSLGLGGSYQPPANITAEDKQNFYERLFLPTEIFPNRSVTGLINYPQNILDIAYYPKERGMYNYNTNLDKDGRLNYSKPEEHFGALSRAITSDNDFDNANIESIEFWMLDPFITDAKKGLIRDGYGNELLGAGSSAGKLVFNLGDISEDVIPDERYNFENGLPIVEKQIGQNIEQTVWGHAPKTQFLVNAFSNEPGARAKQDVGFDGLSNAEERTFFKNFIDRLPASLTPEARQKIIQDPSADDFKFFLGADLDEANEKVLERYKNYVGVEGNAPESLADKNAVTPASTNVPDVEDMNVDNTINDNEAYYEYSIDLKPGQLKVGEGYIVDKTVADGQNWYMFRVPVKEFTGTVGSINGFKSIRFMRMYLTGFTRPVVLRFAQMQMVGQQYRKYTANLDAVGLQEVPEPYDAKFTVGTVSIEENGRGTSSAVNDNNKYTYTLPPGWQRDVDNTQRPPIQLNEQSMSLCVTDLRHGDSRGVFKNVNLDLMFRKRLRMYVHMQSDKPENNQQTGAFVRIGTDLTQNYYEIDIAQLLETKSSATAAEDVWPMSNELNIALADLVAIKSERTRLLGRGQSLPYSKEIDGRKLTVVGNPDLSSVRVIMIGVRNPKTSQERSKSFCIWVDEMHVEGFDQTGGMAGIGQLNVKMADFATLSASGRFETFGFGSVQQRIGERSRNFTVDYGVSSNILLDKLLPQSWGFSIPVFVSYDKHHVTPHFDPLNPDTPLSTTLNNLFGAERDGYERLVEESTVRRGINFSNVRKTKTKPGAKNHFYDFENLSFSYAFSDENRRNILTQEYALRMFKAGVSYIYNSQPKAIEPFKNWKSTSRWTELIRDFNVTPLPNLVSIRAEVDRRFAKTQLRNAELTTAGVDPWYEKYFWFNRYYDLGWALTRNSTLSYNSVANAIIDEPDGDLNTEAKKDSLWNNFKRLGRVKNFDQKIKLAYRLPLDKTPLTDWMKAEYSHTIGYSYMANALNLLDSRNIPYGDILRNSRDMEISGQVDFVMLYNKLRYLKFANSPNVVRKNFARSPGDIEDIDLRPNSILKNVTRMLMTVRGINVSYTQRETTALPGYIGGAPEYFGVNDANRSQLLPFVLGQQDRNFQRKAGENKWITTSLDQNQPFQQTLKREFRANTALEPIKDLRIKLEIRKSRQDVYQEFYRPEDTLGVVFKSQTPVRNGQFEMSFMSFRTAFAKVRSDNSSPIFDTFRAYREPIARKLNGQNSDKTGYYDVNSQDVLIAAFFAAYSGRDTTRLTVNPFLKFPMPNWEIDYTGLAQLPMFKRVFSSISIKHGYTSTYSVGNYTSTLGFEADYVNLSVMNYPLSRVLAGSVDRFQYTPVFSMSTITMVEKFAPLIGIRFQTRGRLTGGLDYNRSRAVALQFSNAVVSELFSQDLNVSLGFTKNNVPLPFKINGVKKKLKNDMTFSMSLKFTDIRDILRKFGSTNSLGIATDQENTIQHGAVNLEFRPTLAYQINNRINFSFYFTHSTYQPFVSTTFYRRTTSGGVQLKFNLAE